MSLVILLCGPSSSRHGDCVNTWAVATISLKYSPSRQAAVSRVSGRRALFVLNDSKSKEWEQIGNLSLENQPDIPDI